MPAEGARGAFSESLARARVAVLALAPEDDSLEVPAAPVADAVAARAVAAVADLQNVLEAEEDTLRAMLAADMAVAVARAGAAQAGERGRVVALLAQALAVLADEPPPDEAGRALPSRSPLALANELRALGGAPLLSGNVVFAVAVNAGALPGSGDGGDTHVDTDARLVASARRLRSFYQQGLIRWLREDASPRSAAERMGEVFARLHALGEGGAGEHLWRAAASFAHLLKDPRWRASAAVKRLLGQLDGRLKRLGEGHVSADDADAVLAQDLLFYVSEGHDVDATIGVFPSRSALLKAFAAPPPAHPDHPTAVLSVLKETLAISGELMEARAPDESWLGRRAWLSERLLHVADGLGLLGAHDLRRRALDEVAMLADLPPSGEPPRGGWGRVAERLHGLGADLLTAAGMETTTVVAEDTAGMPSSGRIARRLEADLVHAEGVIRRLEQGREAPAADTLEEVESLPSVPFDPRPGHPPDLAAEGEAGPAGAPAPPVAPSGGPGPGITGPSVDAALLDDVARIAGDLDGARARLEQQLGLFREGIEDMDGAIRAMREELDGLRAQAGSLLAPQDPDDAGQASPQIRRGTVAGMRERLERLANRLGELLEVRDSIDTIAGDSRAVLVQQARDHVALEQRLMQTRLQPLDTQLDDLRAEVAERAAHAGKQVLLTVDGAGLSIEPEKMAALLPVLRSLTAGMVETGVDPPRARVLAGRPPGCLMTMRFRRRGADLHMTLSADCPAPEEALTAAEGILRRLGGRLAPGPAEGGNSLCTLEIPLAPRVSTVLLVAVGGEILALPLAEVEAVLQVSGEALDDGEGAGVEHRGERWALGYLGDLLALGEPSPAGAGIRMPLVLVASRGGRHALVVDAIGERVDVVVRSVVPQLRAIPGLAGAAIMGDGQVVLLLDVAELVAARSGAPSSGVETVV